MDTSRLELISKKLIKPSISTPPSLRSYKLNIIDQIMPSIYIPIAFLYPNKNNSSFSPNIPTLLENSLSIVLTSWYPLAGRLVANNLDIDCNDIGATLIEARANCEISQISNHTDIVFPSGLPWKTKHDESLLVAQLTHFDCGGKVLSLCMSHKAGDAQTLYNFARDWAAVNRLTASAADQKAPLSPQLNAASIFPPIEDPSVKPESVLLAETKNSITKRCIFNSTKLSQLKAKASAVTGIQNPTRFEVVTALLYKCAFAATSTVLPNSYKPPIFLQPMNIRSLIEPPFTSNSIGNLIDSFVVSFPFDMKDLSFSKLVRGSRKAKVQFYEKFKGVPAKEFRQYVIDSAANERRMRADNESTFDVYIGSSMCKYPFYAIDFGWGNPDRISFGRCPLKNYFVLIDDRNGDGIEAFVSLEDKIMKAFESDLELLQFASIASNAI